MNAREFFDKVSLMRKFQKQYFKTRNKSALQQSKMLEQQVDSEIERVNTVLGIKSDNNQQLSFFDK